MLLTCTTKDTDRRALDPAECDRILRRVYTVYADYALKNPFHTPEMPVKSEAFDSALLKSLLAA